MSGICGLVDYRKSVQSEVLDAMVHAAEHRATVRTDSHIGEGAGLAHLASDLLPESLSAPQPLSDQGVVIVADARLDNRDELLPQLLRSGRLANELPSDAEVILAAYLQWGTEVASRLLGDFAFVVWDGRSRRLFGARDPMAMRALYYRTETGRLLFATELKQILAVPGVPARIFEPAIAAYLMGSFPLGRTAYQGISSLPPGHTLLFDSGGLIVNRFWEFDPGEEISHSNEDDYAEHLLEIFERAVRDRLRSTGPIGILLSGGMDSGSVASTAGKLLSNGGRPMLRAYSWVFPTLSECDERAVSRIITKHFGMAAIDVDIEENHPLNGYPQHGPDRDEPFIGVYQAGIESALDLAAADGVRLMLGGDRGDLLVGGFDISYTHLLMTGHFRGLAAEIDRLARLTNRSRLAVAYDFVLRPGAGIARRLGVGGVMRRLRSGPRDTDRAGPDLPPWLPPEMVEHAQAIGRDALSPPAAMDDPWKRRRYEHVVAPMHMRGVVWSERTYARFGVGFADPFSDVRLAQFVLAIPQVVLNRPGRVDKRLLRLAMAGTTPAEALRQARKVSPQPLWYRSLRDWESHTVTDLLTHMQAADRGFVDERELKRHYRSVQAGGRPKPELWWALSLEMWLRAFWS